MPRIEAHPERLVLPEVLRALAMLAVLVVNGAGYLTAPWGAVLGERTPADSPWAAAVQGLIAALLQGKGYPVLAFVFGMGLWLSLRGLAPAQARERVLRRQRRLLGLGMLHGVFVYFGDILTMYALVGWNLLRRLREPWRLLRRRLVRALVWALAATLLPLLMLVLAEAYPGTPASAEPTLTGAGGWLDFWTINGLSYLLLQALGLVLAWPVIRLCMLCGVAAARLRLLTHRRWRAALARLTRRWLLPVLLCNLAYGLAFSRVPVGQEEPLWLYVFGHLAGLPLAALYLAALAWASQGGAAAWCRWFAPLGSRTLTLYLVHGLLGMALFSGAGLGWRPTTLEMLAVSLLLWALALVAAQASGPRRWPFERWLARR